MRPAAITLLALFGLACRAAQSAPPPVVIPPTPCVMPAVPKPMGTVSVKDCDGDGPGQVICMDEQSAVVMLIYVRQLQAWVKLATACPGYHEEVNAVGVPSVPTLVEPTREET